MSYRVQWFADDPTAQSFLLEKSTDKGVSYTTLTTIAYDTTGVNYDPRLKVFFYVDAGGAAGHVYRLTVTGTQGVSPPSFIVVPMAAPDMCHIIGYVRSPFGEVDQSVKVDVFSFGSRGERWMKSPSGLLGINPEALGVTNAQKAVFPNADGMWEVLLVQGTYARIFIPEMSFEWTFLVPSVTGPVNIRDIAQLRGQERALYSEQTGDQPNFSES